MERSKLPHIGMKKKYLNEQGKRYQFIEEESGDTGDSVRS